MDIPKGLDMSSMRELIDFFPEMLGAIDLPESVEEEAEAVSSQLPAGIVMAGMGGSSIAGQYCQELLIRESTWPLVTVRDYSLPKYVDENWTMIAVSYSGNTEETLSCFEDAIRRNCDSFAITSGGKLAEQACVGRMINLPEGFQPRAALPMIFSAEFDLMRLLLRLPKYDLISVRESVIGAKEKWGAEIVHPREMAKTIQGKIPIFIGAHHLKAVAYRAKCQINENAKSTAFHATIPESNHNEVEAINTFSQHDISVVFIRSSFETENISRRFDVTEELYADTGVETQHLNMDFENHVEEMLAMTHLVDEISLQLALLYDVNPVDVPSISRLKKLMSG